jgi:hypothetical protein
MPSPIDSPVLEIIHGKKKKIRPTEKEKADYVQFI